MTINSAIPLIWRMVFTNQTSRFIMNNKKNKKEIYMIFFNWPLIRGLRIWSNGFLMRVRVCPRRRWTNMTNIIKIPIHRWEKLTKNNQFYNMKKNNQFYNMKKNNQFYKNPKKNNQFHKNKNQKE